MHFYLLDFFFLVFTNGSVLFAPFICFGFGFFFGSNSAAAIAIAVANILFTPAPFLLFLTMIVANAAANALS